MAELGTPGADAEGNPASSQALPADDDIRSALKELLKTADLQTTTEKKLRKQLEEQLGCPDLTGKKPLIKAEVEAWLAEQDPDEEEEEEEEAGEEEAEEKPAAKRKRGGGGGGLNKGCVLSPEMAAFIGEETMSRPQVVRKIWDYIKDKNLQDPKNRRNIILDDKLRTIFTPPVNMFSMNKQLSKHVKASDEVTGRSKRKAASEEEEEEEDDENEESEGEEGAEEEGEEEGGRSSKRAKPARAAPKPRAKPAKAGSGKPNGFQKPVQLSEQLAEFVGESSMSRPELTKKFWAYYKENNLMDPTDKRMILCDQRLKDLFKVDRFQAFGMMKYLKEHIVS